MKYYVVADVHGFYSELRKTLEEKGFFADEGPRKLIICGDVFDRGREAREMQEFILELMKKDEVILVRGNHEDLALDLIEDAEYYFETEMRAFNSHHARNGTIATFMCLAETSFDSMLTNVKGFQRKAENTPYVKKIIPAMMDYFETKNYIFVHGYIPCEEVKTLNKEKCYFYQPDWRNASEEEWKKARWYNGMLCQHLGVLEDGKTIVCGHFHCSFGHTMYEMKTGEEDFSPYYSEGIIAIDACTAYSRQINCIIIEDEEL